MDGKQLKNSILQWAIQGKLVPQNPKDEPASLLLEKIWNEKHKLAEKGKIKKKDLVREPIADDEIPFELPANWEWCRLEDIVWHLSDGTHKTPKYTESGIPFVSVKNMSSGRLSFTNTKFVSKEESDILNQRCNPEKGDLLLSKVGTTGIPVIVDVDFQFSLFVSLALIKFFPNLIDSSFFVYSIYSPLVQTQVKEHTRGVGNKNWVLNDIAKTILAIPPLAEQKRIVAKLEQVLPLAEEYGAAQEQLDKLNKELPETLKKSILQEAIQGKLVPQNPKDEPAQKLLERITVARSESSQPKGAKSKKSTPTSRIYCENGTWYEQIGNAEPKDITDEIPFDIPTSWVWCRLGQCSDYGATKEKAKSFDGMKDSWSLDLEDIEKNSGRIVKRLKVCERKIVGEKVVFKKGQVLYSKLRPYLKKILVAPEDGVCSSEIVPFSPFEYLDADYLVTVLKSPHVDYTINLVTYGVKMPRVGTDTMLNLLIPLPPLAEQKRIVAKLEQLFKVL